MQQALDSPGEVAGRLIEGDAERQRQGVAEGGADQLPGADAGVEGAAEDAGLLPLGDDAGEQVFAVEVERAHQGHDLLVVGLDEGAVHDAELDGVDPGAAQVHVGDGVQLGQRVERVGRLGVPALQGRRPDLLQHLQEQRLLAAEMAVQHRLGDARGRRDLLRRRGVVAQRREQLLHQTAGGIHNKAGRLAKLSGAAGNCSRGSHISGQSIGSVKYPDGIRAKCWVCRIREKQAVIGGIYKDSTNIERGIGRDGSRWRHVPIGG